MPKQKQKEKRLHFAGYDFTAGPEGTVVHRPSPDRLEFRPGDRVEYRDVNLWQQGTVTGADGKWVMVRWDGRSFESREWAPNLRHVASASRHHATKKSPAQLQREIDEALAKGPTGAPPSPVNVGDFVSFQSKHDGSTVKGRVVEVAWLGGDHWSAMVKMAGRPGNAIVRADELTKLSKKPDRSHATIATGGINTVNEFWDLYEAELVKSVLDDPAAYALRQGESAGEYGRRIRERFQQTAESSGLGQINLDSNTFKRVARRLGIAKFSQKALKTAYLGLAR